jgi:hypothetical protein
MAGALNGIALCSWEYADEPNQEYVGLIIEDASGSPVVDRAVVRGDRVDLYGLASMNIAANQVQAQQLQMLTQRIQQLETALTTCQ